SADQHRAAAAVAGSVDARSIEYPDLVAEHIDRAAVLSAFAPARIERPRYRHHAGGATIEHDGAVALGQRGRARHTFHIDDRVEHRVGRLRGHHDLAALGDDGPLIAD